MKTHVYGSPSILDPMKAELLENYNRLIHQLKEEVKGYASYEQMFEVLPGTTNSGGNLTMHLIGNLRHFYGALLVEDGYVREREKEFNNRIPREKMLRDIEFVQEMLNGYFDSISEETPSEKYPIPFFGNEVTKGWVYLQLLHHLGYHLGQINYHRRYFTNL